MYIEFFHFFHFLFSMYPTAIFHPSPSVLLICLLPQFHSSSIFLQNRAGLPGIATEHNATRVNKMRHQPLVWRLDVATQLEEMGPKGVGKRQLCPSSQSQESHINTKLTNNHILTSLTPTTIPSHFQFELSLPSACLWVSCICSHQGLAETFLIVIGLGTLP